MMIVPKKLQRAVYDAFLALRYPETYGRYTEPQYYVSVDLIGDSPPKLLRRNRRNAGGGQISHYPIGYTPKGGDAA